eukprot:Gb_31757 [translate_table: standard]
MKKLYYELTMTEPFRSQLAHKTIIEYPVVHVVLPANSMEFELGEDLDPVPEKVVKPLNVDEMEDLKLDDLVKLEGIPFREEEIEEGEFVPHQYFNDDYLLQIDDADMAAIAL